MKYFTLKEFTASQTAQRLGINNQLPKSLEKNVEFLINNVLDPIRSYIGCQVYINSGYRCPLLNKAVGGVAGSQHLLGQAADITTKDRKKNLLIVDWATQFATFDQMIIYKDFIHISYSSNHNRKQIIYKCK